MKLFICLILFAWACLSDSTIAAELKTKNVILVTVDGLRWQELFMGAEERLMTREAGGVTDTNALRTKFWRETPEARREALMPFFWSTIAKKGQIFGNTNKGSTAKITNDKKFSYPGYNEIFTGAADPRIDSNNRFPNPNTNVFEWLQTRPGLKKEIAAFGNWDVFPYILNRERSGLFIWTGWEKAEGQSRLDLLSRVVQDSTPTWHGATFDSFIFHAASDYLKTQKPRVLYIGLGETDEWAHGGRYDNYLLAANNVDRFIRELWQTAQSIPQYRDKTTFIVTTDHGRGSQGTTWKDHGAWVEGAEFIWFAVIGPDTEAMGERSNLQMIEQNQVAATLAAFLGEDFHAVFPKSGQVISEVFGKRTK